MQPTSSLRRDLFIGSSLFLFMELAFIRWLPAQVLFLTFFTNTVLLASFLGLSLGCLAAGHRRNYLALTPLLLVVTMTAGAAMEWIRLALQDIIDVGKNAASPQMVYFGTEVRVRDLASFAIPIELVAGLFFLLVAATMIGVGQLLGRRFREMSNPVEAYLINIGGSLAGVLLFNIFSWWLSPLWWFGVVAIGLAYFLLRETPPKWWAVGFAIAAPVLLLVQEFFPVGVIREKFPVESWSPYYRINYAPQARTIVVNLIGQQTMLSRHDPYPAYALPYLLNRDAGQQQFHDILIIGAGSGNDVSRALEWAAPDARIDAVEIDPIILRLGRQDHPDRPYQDPRVATHLDDGRNFLRFTTKKYDLIVFALIDSLVLHSSLSNIRLESYLFTKESMADVRRRLKPDGLFVMYNYFRQGWIVSRLAKTVEGVFERPTVVLTMPYRERIDTEQKAEGFTLFFEGPRTDAIEKAFQSGAAYLVPSDIAPTPSSPNGFRLGTETKSIRFLPTKVDTPAALRVATDVWPFLYLRNPMIPDLSRRGMAVIGIVSLVLLWIFGWRTGKGAFTSLDARMLLLGAGFMLLETKAVVHMAVMFGSTWIVNTVVFSAVLVMILAANLWVLKRHVAGVVPYYVALVLMLAVNIAVPLDSFLGWPRILQGVAAGALVLSPVFFAGVIFAKSFDLAKKPEQALAYNTAGAILGGIAETSSLLIGFQWLLAVAAVIYVASALFGTRARES
jgi:spermidine synthase